MMRTLLLKTGLSGSTLLVVGLMAFSALAQEGAQTPPSNANDSAGQAPVTPKGAKGKKSKAPKEEKKPAPADDVEVVLPDSMRKAQPRPIARPYPVTPLPQRSSQPAPQPPGPPVPPPPPPTPSPPPPTPSPPSPLPAQAAPLPPPAPVPPPAAPKEEPNDLLLNPVVAPPPEKPEVSAEERTPPFRTDLGVDLFLGLNICVGGDGNATLPGSCSGMKPGVAVGGSFFHRPYSFLAVGFDLNYREFKGNYHHEWGDFFGGPKVRGILPLGRIEPFIDFGVGYAESWYRGVGSATVGETIDQKGEFRGIAISAAVGADYFFLPGLGAGLDVRLLHPFFQESCWTLNAGSYCRDDGSIPVDDDKADWDPGPSGQSTRLSFGAHGIYYF